MWVGVRRPVVEEDNCRPNIVELARTNVAEACNAANSDDYLSGGGTNDIAANSDDTDACKDSRAVTL